MQQLATDTEERVFASFSTSVNYLNGRSRLEQFPRNEYYTENNFA